MKTDIYAALTEASVRVLATKQPGDHGKWAHYSKLSKPEQLAWRLREGHREFGRLQRLAFHAHIGVYS